MTSSPETLGSDRTSSSERRPHDCNDSDGEEIKPPFAIILAERLSFSSVFVDGGELLVLL